MQPFRYTRPASLGDAVRAASRPGAVVIAGGTTVVDLMRADVLAPQSLVDVSRLAELRSIETAGPVLRFGALASMADVAEDSVLNHGYPALAESLKLAASQQLRNAATLAGNLLQRTRCPYFRDGASACNKRDPGSGCAALDGTSRYLAVLGTTERCIAAYPGDWGTALAAFDTSVEVQGTQGRRTIPFPELHVAYGDDPARDTTLRPGDVITAILVRAARFGRRSAYAKLRDRASYAFALASAAVALDMDGDQVREARVALGGVAGKPWRSHAAEAELTGKALSPEVLRRAGDAAFAGARAPVPVAWKVELGKRALAQAATLAARRKV